MDKFGDARDKDTFKGGKSTMPARTRDGATYPGGRKLRRTLKLLAARQKEQIRAPHAGTKQHKHMPPGSMQAR